MGKKTNRKSLKLLLFSLAGICVKYSLIILRDKRLRSTVSPFILTTAVTCHPLVADLLELLLDVGSFYMYSIFPEETDMTWVPVLALAMYVVTSMIGLLSIPWTMTAELFPIEIRGIAHSITNSFANLLMFFSIQNYYSLCELFGGVSGIQYFFAVISVGGALYSYVFLPETHMKKLSQIQDYFVHNMMYLGQKKKPTRSSSNVRKRTTNKDIVRTNDKSQNQVLLVK